MNFRQYNMLTIKSIDWVVPPLAKGGQGDSFTSHQKIPLNPPLRKGDLRIQLCVVVLLLFSLVGFLQPAFAQEYIIQAGDFLAITFWQQPDLNTEVTVSQGGTIDVPVIGRTTAAGLTPAQLSDKIVDHMSRYRINITQASVKVRQYEGNKVFVTGQVAAPGAYTFEVMPDLWRILQEAGGPLETADLTHVTIIRGEGTQGKIIPVDLSQYFKDGNVLGLPRIQGSDTIHLPAVQASAGASEVPTSPFLDRSEIYLAGAVASPGRYNLEKHQDILDALIMAGGPAPDAKLTDVRVIKRLAFGNTSVLKINLQKYLERAEPRPPLLHPGDTIFVPRKRGGLAVFAESLLLSVASAALFYWLFGTIR